jgi:hypothetical protein
MTESATTISSSLLPPSEEQISALSLWAFTLGVFALLTFGLTAIPSIVCGHRALGRENGSLAKLIARVGLVIGYLGTAVLGAWIAVLARTVLQ